MVLGKRLETGQPIEAGQLHVEQDEVRLDPLQQRQQFVPVTDLADEDDVLFLLEHKLHRIAHQRVVLCEDDPDRAHSPVSPLPLAAPAAGDVLDASSVTRRHPSIPHWGE